VVEVHAAERQVAAERLISGTFAMGVLKRVMGLKGVPHMLKQMAVAEVVLTLMVVMTMVVTWAPGGG
jgi:hypothetical protein